MTGVLYSYLSGIKTTAFLFSVFFVALSLVFAFTANIFFAINVVFAGIGTLGFQIDVCFNKYLRIMPIRKRTIIASRYIFSSACLAVSVVWSLVLAIVSGENFTTSFNSLLIFLGMYLMVTGLYIAFTNVAKTTFSHIIGIVPLFLPLSLIGFSGLREVWDTLMSDARTFEEITFLHNTNIWLLFFAISLAVYILMYFVSIFMHKKIDYK